MPTYKLSPLAEEDLYKIISTTIESWGSTPAKVYAQTMPDFNSVHSEIQVV